MPDLDFQVEGAEVVAYEAAPLLAFKLRLTQVGPDKEDRRPIHSVMLRCQIRIEPARRSYRAAEQERLLDLFGEPHRWGQTLCPMLWTHTNVMVPAFTGTTLVDLPVPCTYDFNVAAAKYFHALEDGLVPLCLLFSGTIFYEAIDQGLQVAQISWEKEAYFRLPIRIWREMMDRYYPNGAWLFLRRDVLDRLHEYKRKLGLPTWEQALESLLEGSPVVR
jgi:hypothetical protein